MICPPCREGGRWLTSVLYSYGRLHDQARDVIVQRHARCTGCPCQHQLRTVRGPHVLQPAGESQQIGPLLHVPDMGALS